MMIFTKEQVYETCKLIAPQHEFDPKLIYAVCLQEGEKEGHDFDPSVVRLEQGFYRRYVEQFTLASTTEALLACSWGVMQMMGVSLKELGYFSWYHVKNPAGINLGDPLSEIAVPKALNYYCINLDLMIDWGCAWMATKRSKAKGDTVKMLSYWNGDMTGEYANKVLAKWKAL